MKYIKDTIENYLNMIKDENDNSLIYLKQNIQIAQNRFLG